MSSIQRIALERRGIRVNDDGLRPRHGFRAVKLPATIQRERIAARYDARSNTCSTCHTQRSLSGRCDCN